MTTTAHNRRCTGSGPTKTAVAAVKSELDGIPQTGSVLGKATAPVTMAYFGDLECPICKDFTLGALGPIIERWVRPGKLRIEYLSLQTATREPEIFRSQPRGARPLCAEFLESRVYRKEAVANEGRPP